MKNPIRTPRAPALVRLDGGLGESAGEGGLAPLRGGVIGDRKPSDDTTGGESAQTIRSTPPPDHHNLIDPPPSIKAAGCQEGRISWIIPA